MLDDLKTIEISGVFSNYGPVNARFEHAARTQLFGGSGECLTVCNATAGLMMAIRAVARPGRYALMPSFTFAATAQAAIWAGLTPLFCDIDPATWLPDAADEARLLAAYGAEIAVLIPCTTFGAPLDLPRYRALAERHGVPVVVDAAAALGALDARGAPFAAGCPFPVVFSMHATKPFAVGEGGLVYADNPALMRTLRSMGNFGFGRPRVATLPGLNAKLSEIAALLALGKLADYDRVLAHRSACLQQYRAGLPGWSFQRPTGLRQPLPFVAAVPPEGCGRDHLRQTLAEAGIGSGAYFSPHLAEQPHFAGAPASDLRNTGQLARRIIALPVSDTLTQAEVEQVCAVLRTAAPSEDAPPPPHAGWTRPSYAAGLSV